MNGTREIPATVVPTPPAFPNVTRNAAIIPRSANFNTPDATVSAWYAPESTYTFVLSRMTRTAHVPAIYITAISKPDIHVARARVRRGSRISSLIADASSSPVNAKAICGQKFTVSQFHTGQMFDQVKWVADPCFHQIATAAPISNSSGT